MTQHRLRPRQSGQRLHAAAEQARQTLEAKRPTSPLLDALFGSVQLHDQAGGALLAGAIAFRFFMFLVPGTFVLVMGLGVGSDAAGADPREVARQVGIAGLAADAIRSGADASATTRWITFGVALVGFVAGARNLLKALMIAHALIWQVPRRRLRRPAVAALTLVVATPVLGVLLLLTYRIRSVSLTGEIVGLALYSIVPAGVWLACSVRLFPAGAGVTWRDVWPGAALFGAGLQALHLTTVLWIAPSMSSKTETYGALGTALALLLWAYFLGRLVTSAAALNAALWRRSRPAGARTLHP